MITYLVNILLTLLLGICLIYVQPTKQKRKIFCWISSISWILLSGLRHTSVGADTLQYGEKFDVIGQTPWSDIFEAMRRVYLEGYESASGFENFLYKDPGYSLFQKIAHIFTDSYQVYLIIVATIFFAAMGRFIYKNSEDPCFSFILFSTLFYSFYAVTGHRQTLATALVVFIGYEFIKERKFWQFLLVSLVAILLHKSAVLFIPFYFLSQIKVRGVYVAILTLFSGTVFTIGGSAVLWLANLFGFERDAVYEAPTYTFTTLIVLVTIVVVLCYRSFRDVSPHKNIEVSATMLAAMFALFTLLDQTMMRVQQYYSLTLMLSLPSAFTTFKPKNRLLVTMLCTFALIVLFIRTGAWYKFFWQ